MKKHIYLMLMTSLAVVALLASCGKKEEKAGEEAQKSTEATSKLVEIAKEAADEVTIEEDLGEDIPAMIESAGYTLKSYDSFPTEEVGRKGRMLVYTDKKGKRDGGVIYFKKTGPAIAPCWHWYFENAVPDAVSNVELNDDGLWDVKITTKNGDAMTFIQDDSFSLIAKDRTDYIATNAKSSPPISEDAAVWRCFDGDSTTAWKSEAASDGGSFIEIHVPFGVREGNLAIETLDTDRPKSCTVYADGKEIEVVDFEGKAAGQLVHLGQDAQGAKLIRLAFTPGQGQGGVVAVAEIGLK